MPRIRPEDWRPNGIPSLEPEAWRALRHRGCTCVVAGPGSGKTEFLTQRAIYLLETAVCSPPHRVLAISFKSDAAENLAARMRKRCPPELASRFVSMTFDAFTKSLVDRFQQAAPEHWRPTRPYDIRFPTRRQVEGFLSQAQLAAPPEWRRDIAEISVGEFEPVFIGGRRLPARPEAPISGGDFVANRWWHEQLRAQRSTLTFVAINRLAELIVRVNPHIRRALRATYPFVFVDEFQDTTYAQYDFLLSAFGDPAITITAVGDDKQRIMTWAGARPDAFPRFEADFRAIRIPLHFNFRSSADLVHIQQVVAQAIDPAAVHVVAQAPRAVDGDVAQVWNSPDVAAEVAHVARWIARDMTARSLSPRDYAILVRQTADAYEAELAGALGGVGLRVRNESRALGRTTLQDLLADEACRIAVSVLRLGAARRAPLAWQAASSALQGLRGADPEDEAACHRADAELIAFSKALRREMAAAPPSAELAASIAARVFAFLKPAALAQTFAAYGTGDLLPIIMEAVGLHLSECAARSETWSACLDAFEGVSHIPLMTVHKSKGLEYDTIVFVGLDDRAWWSYTPDNPEGLATFFVALSRAKQRALFAFCQQRGRRKRIADLYRLLADAGVPEIAI